jgi:hypothetical protein
MRLTRRQTVATVLAGGLATSAALQSLPARGRSGGSREADVTDAETQSLTALAEVVSPADVSDPAVLVEGYLRYQPSDSREGIREAIAALDTQARRRYGGAFATLSAAERERLLRELGVDRTAPVRDGTVPERVRYHLVNGLLYALYTNPAGSRQLGVENPRGHPGGYESYAESPDEGSR